MKKKINKKKKKTRNLITRNQIYIYINCALELVKIIKYLSIHPNYRFIFEMATTKFIHKDGSKGSCFGEIPHY